MTTRAPRSVVETARRHPILTIVAWCSFAALSWVAASLNGGELFDGLSVPGSDSAAASEVAGGPYLGPYLGPSATVVISADAPFTADQQADIERVLSTMSTAPEVAGVDQPFLDDQISDSGRHAYASVRFGFIHEVGTADLEFVEQSTSELAADGLTVEIGGLLPDVVADPAPDVLEYLGIAIALIAVALALGSAGQALAAVTATGVGVGAALGWAMFASTYVAMSSTAIQLAALVGMGVGIDYALLVLRRHHDDAPLAQGSVYPSVRLAGATVAASTIGLVVLNVPFFSVAAVVTAGTVGMVVATTHTLLPALTVRRSRSSAIPWVGRSSDRHRAHLRRIVANPGRFLVVGALVVCALLSPLSDLQLGTVTAEHAAADSSRAVAFDTLRDEFGPGDGHPLFIVIEFNELLPWDREPMIDEITAALAANDDIAEWKLPVWGFEGQEAILEVTAANNPLNGDGAALLADVRGDLHTIVSSTISTAHVGGPAATRIDLTERVSNRLLAMVLLVVSLSLALLLWRWRTPVLAIKAALLNACSVAVGYGVLVAVFEYGWGASLIGVEAPIPIDPIVPVFLLAILFGLSMDYEVFLIDAIRRHFDAGADNNDAIVSGLAGTRRVIVVAAVVMAGVFSGFIAGIDPTTKMFGIGLVAAIMFDATFSRAVLVPATLVVLGRANQWIPKALTPKAHPTST